MRLTDAGLVNLGALTLLQQVDLPHYGKVLAAGLGRRPWSQPRWPGYPGAWPGLGLVSCLAWYVSPE